jgi:hypothetical protein
MVGVVEEGEAVHKDLSACAGASRSLAAEAVAVVEWVAFERSPAAQRQEAEVMEGTLKQAAVA